MIAVTELRWLKTVGAAVDPAQRIALLMRVLERSSEQTAMQRLGRNFRPSLL